MAKVSSRYSVGDDLFGQLLIAPLGSAGTYGEYVAVSEDAPLARVPTGLDADVASVSIVLETPLLTVGEFRCPPADTAWSALNLIGDRPQVVFPRLPVLIEHERGTPLVTAPTHTVLYNANQHYRRELRNPRGDDCVFVELSEASLEQLAEAGGPSSTYEPARRHPCARPPEDVPPPAPARAPPSVS